MSTAYRPKLFGTNSFALIDLSLIFDMVDGLESCEEGESVSI
jgi:hypothetical protein